MIQISLGPFAGSSTTLPSPPVNMATLDENNMDMANSPVKADVSPPKKKVRKTKQTNKTSKTRKERPKKNKHLNFLTTLKLYHLRDRTTRNLNIKLGLDLYGWRQLL